MAIILCLRGRGESPQHGFCLASLLDQSHGTCRFGCVGNTHDVVMAFRNLLLFLIIAYSKLWEPLTLWVLHYSNDIYLYIYIYIHIYINTCIHIYGIYFWDALCLLLSLDTPLSLCLFLCLSLSLCLLHRSTTDFGSNSNSNRISFSS